MNFKLVLRSITRRPLFKILKAILPSILILIMGLAGFGVWVVYKTAHPPQAPYLTTPNNFKILSDRGVQATEESWSNKDGTTARGWLLRGAEGKPAVILLHHYGADRSWLLNLGVKLNESTDYTILWPDLRGHGQNPPVKWTSFGGAEADDTTAAIEYLRTLKNAAGKDIVGDNIGIYGIELGGYVAVMSAQKDPKVKTLVLDSVPASSENILYHLVKSRSVFDLGLLQPLTRIGASLYLRGYYQNKETCNVANSMNGRNVMLLAGADSSVYRESTSMLANCFPKTNNVESITDLSASGLNLVATSPQQSETYDRRVIDFFTKTLTQ